MLNFDFHNPTRILFGKGRIADLGAAVPAAARILVLYGGGSARANGVLAQVQAALAGRVVHEFGGIEPNPSYETLMQAVELARREKLDFLLAVGGGSVIDGTKFVAAAVNYDGDTWEIARKWGSSIQQALPFGSVLTLPATGSEMNNGAVITLKARNLKQPFSSPHIFPQFSILDPSVTFTLPPRQVANGVVDAYTHVMEQYLTYPVNAPLQDRFAEGILQTLLEEGPKTLSEPDDYDARANLMWCATLALNGLLGAGVPQDWSTHLIGHELTALYGLDHGQTLAIVLPATMAVRRQTKRAKLLQYAARIWQLREGDEDARIDRAIACTREFFESIGIKTRLSDYGLGEQHISAVLAQLEARRLVKLGERADVDLQVSRQVLEACV